MYIVDYLFCPTSTVNVCDLKSLKYTFATNTLIPEGPLGSLYTNIAQLIAHLTIVCVAAYHAFMLPSFLWHLAKVNWSKGTYTNLANMLTKYIS